MNRDETYMMRCIQLAEKASGYTAPNPMVGAVLVHNDIVIGEGYHKQFGQPHAEVNCIANVAEEKRKLISSSVLYVNLEPCSHTGKTPPCTKLIIENSIPAVIIGMQDPFAKVNGSGIRELQNHGVKVPTGVLEKESLDLNRRFVTFHTRHRPYVILKWAQTVNKKIASGDTRLLITTDAANRLVHKWRSEEGSILVGKNTALLDDPQLNNRLWPGPSPLRIVIDPGLELSGSLHLFSGDQKTICFNNKFHGEKGNVMYYQIGTDATLVSQVLNGLYQMGIQSVLVEGGARVLQSFIEEKVWDEARVLENTNMHVASGLSAPELANHSVYRHESIEKIKLSYFKNILPN